MLAVRRVGVVLSPLLLYGTPRAATRTTSTTGARPTGSSPSSPPGRSRTSSSCVRPGRACRRPRPGRAAGDHAVGGPADRSSSSWRSCSRGPAGPARPSASLPDTPNAAPSAHFHLCARADPVVWIGALALPARARRSSLSRDRLVLGGYISYSLYMMPTVWYGLWRAILSGGHHRRPAVRAGFPGPGDRGDRAERSSCGAGSRSPRASGCGAAPAGARSRRGAHARERRTADAVRRPGAARAST